MTNLGSSLDFTSAPPSSLGLHCIGAAGTIVGRTTQLAAIEQELTSARSGLACLTVEGEPGIGKTRLLVAAETISRDHGFLPISVTADEEIRGPFLLARSMFASAAALVASSGTPAEAAFERVLDALSNHDDPGLGGMAPNQRLLRVYDLGAVALRTLAAQGPLAILIDDLQWADEDSLRLLRYMVRSNTSSAILLVVATRPDEIAFLNEAVTLLADIERMGFLRRLTLGRFKQAESTELLHHSLGGRINLTSAAVMHAQAEGVPFVLVEQARAYREVGMIQLIDGVWCLARNADRLLPSAVRTLIQRRSARLPESTRLLLAEAAILGRNFSLRDLEEVKRRLGSTTEAYSLAETLAPAVTAGLLNQNPDGSAADYTFTHEQIREHGAASLTPPRRRAIHGAIVDLLTGGGEPAPGCLTMLAQHALAAGRPELGARLALEAGRNALQMHAPEEALRLIDLAHPVTASAQARVALLCLRDDALAMLRQASQRLESLAEMSALAEALGDSHVELDVMLRRAAALRLSQDHDSAADIARRVIQLAAERQDLEVETAACLELGQDLMRTELGEGYTQASSESDLEGAEEAFGRAALLAQEIGDDGRFAAATRELGIISLSHLRAEFVKAIYAGEHVDMLRRLASGDGLSDIMPELSYAHFAMEATARLRQALEIYERLGDRQGSMSTIIALAYVSGGPEIHLTGSAKRIEQIRRLMGRKNSFTKESERALADAQMVFGSQIYAQSRGFPDAALGKGLEAYRAGRAIGERTLEFAAAGGLALVNSELGDFEESQKWLDRAAAVNLEAPTPWRHRQLELWRGMVCADRGDAKGMRQHLERAVQLAAEQGRAAERCQALAQLALCAARLGSETSDEELLSLAERSATQAKSLAALLPGHAPWGGQADAALAQVSLARGSTEAAAGYGRSALDAIEHTMHEDLFLDVRLPAADAILFGGTEEERAKVRDQLRVTLGLISQRIGDERVRTRWFRSRTGRELYRLAAPAESPVNSVSAAEGNSVTFLDSETRLLQLLAQGHTNREIAENLDVAEEAVMRQLGELFVKIGVSSRADAMVDAVMRNLV